MVEPSLTPDAAEEKRAHVRPLAKENLGDIHDTAWEVSAEVDGQKATAAETGNTLEPQVSPVSIVFCLNRNTNPSHKVPTSIDGAERTESSTDAQDHESSGLAKLVTDGPKPMSEPRANEPSPLFAHECLTPEHEEAEVYLHVPEETKNGPEEETRILEDCELEMFPTDREHILQRILTTKVSLDEDETSPDGIPSGTSVPPEVLVDSLPSSRQSSPQLGPIAEEDISNTAVLPSLNVSDPVQPDQGPEASRQVPASSGTTEATGPEDFASSDHSPPREDRGLPVDALTQVLDPGLATLGPLHSPIEQHPKIPETEAQYTSPGVDGAADLFLFDSVTPKLHFQTSAASESPGLGRRRSVPGSFEEPEEDVDRVSQVQKKTVENSRSTCGEGEMVIDGSREGSDPVNRPATPSTVGVELGRKYESLFQVFWRIIIVNCLGAILARFTWKSGERK